MANRRMFSKSIVRSSKFLKMPATSRLLYYDLGMEADDDGYAEYFVVMRTSGSSEQDLNVLVANSFVQVFDDYVLIMRDWKENNYLRNDRYTPSKYLSVYQMDTKCIPTVSTGKDRLGKDRLGEVRIEGEDAQPSLKETKFSKREEIVDSVIQEIADNYQVPVDFVEDCWDTAKNWLDSKGKLQKDYKAFLCNWVKREKADRLYKNKRLQSAGTARGGVIYAGDGKQLH